jgi:dCMP deaminase
MEFNVFTEMESAVSIVKTSAHKKNKVSATIFGMDFNDTPYSLSKTNFWPQTIESTIGVGNYIGNSSGTVHAETACILAAPKTEGASLAVTDPFCPNCAKNIAEAGIKKVYVDSKGFDKDFAKRRKAVFEGMSLKVCEKAGIGVYELNRKAETIVPILDVPDDFIAQEEDPIVKIPLESAGNLSFKNIVLHALDTHWKRKFAVAFVKASDEKMFGIYARSHPVFGHTMAEGGESLMEKVGKYSYFQEPLNRILMNAARLGVEIQNGFVFTSYVPTSREHVNFIGAGLDELMVGDVTLARDEDSLDAMHLLKQHGLIKYRALVA